MKTNHQRGFVAASHRDSSMFCISARGQLSDISVSAWHGNDFTNGHRGMAKSKRGVKKFVRSRIRHHENAATKRLIRTESTDE